MAREFENDEDILVWADSLDERWPERVEVRRHIVEAARSLRCSQPRILELCSGDGRLSGEVLLAVPDATAIGVDASKTLGRYVNQQFGIEVLEADLAGLEWAEGIEGCFDLVYTLQSMHDIGGEEAISKIYQACAKLIAPGGWLMVADFVVTEEAFDPDKPGRLPIAWHLGALSDAGFSTAVCSLETGKLACMVGDMPD